MTKTSMTHMITIYQDKSGGWRWRLQRWNNRKIVADGSETYASKFNVERAISMLPLDWKKTSIRGGNS